MDNIFDTETRLLNLRCHANAYYAILWPLENGEYNVLACIPTSKEPNDETDVLRKLAYSMLAQMNQAMLEQMPGFPPLELSCFRNNPTVLPNTLN